MTDSLEESLQRTGKNNIHLLPNYHFLRLVILHGICGNNGTEKGEVLFVYPVERTGAFKCWFSALRSSHPPIMKCKQRFWLMKGLTTDGTHHFISTQCFNQSLWRWSDSALKHLTLKVLFCNYTQLTHRLCLLIQVLRIWEYNTCRYIFSRIEIMVNGWGWIFFSRKILKRMS